LKTVYLAGFDVFCADAIARGQQLKALCAAHGLLGIYPLDAQPPQNVEHLAQWICQSNLQSIKQADAVLANLGNFRGAEPDSGTVFEVGYASALGKPVWAYFADHRAMTEQLVMDEQGNCNEGYQVEAFGLPKNLMLSCSWAGASDSAAAGVAALAAYLR
jgi:nucleoside 2-deoxyribosyltransferase